jgi:uncharacterized protein (DUF302 family)
MPATRQRLAAILAVITIVALPAVTTAQVQTGSILVRAVDEQGGAIPGVTVTITSSALVAGTATGIADAGGAYRFPSLPPGTYSVKVDLQGFQTVIRENVTVLVGQTTPLDLSMKVATVAETITVSGASPVIDTTSATVAVNLSEQLLQATPGGRDIWGLVEFGVLTTIDVQHTLKQKLDRDFRKYVILGACNPPLADRALHAELEVGLLLPCNVIVYETSPGRSAVSAIAPLAALGIVGDNPELHAVAEEADRRLRAALSAVEALAATVRRP